jgi:hypothetical protein
VELFRLPEVPVTVIGYWPGVAAPLTDSVSVLVFVVEVGVNIALVFGGMPSAVSATDPLNPCVGTTVIVVVCADWRGTVSAEGDAVNEKLPTGIVRVIVVVALRLPEVPVIVTVYVPGVAVLLAVKVTTLLVVAGFTLKEAVTPVGNPEAARVTLPENPFTGVIVNVLLPPVAPLATLRVVGDAESLKLWAGVTVKLMVVA